MPPYQHSIRTEIELRRLVSELSQLRSEVKDKPKTNIASIFASPTWLAVLGAIVSVATGFWQLQANRQLEREKLRSNLIQEASKSGDPATTLKNLKFLVKAGLVDDEKGAIASLKLDDAPSFLLPSTAPMSSKELLENFGDPKLAFKSGEDRFITFGTPDEAWVSANLVDVEIPELVGVPGFPKSGKIKFHRKAAAELQAAMAEISRRGLMHKIRSFDGAWVPRNIPGRSNVYSTHAFGIAFDINSRFTPLLGAPPLAAHKEDSVAELVPIFESHGFYWGGRFPRPDPGHFQFGVHVSTLKVESIDSGQIHQ
jgi:hypothetical protein